MLHIKLSGMQTARKQYLQKNRSVSQQQGKGRTINHAQMKKKFAHFLTDVFSIMSLDNG